MSALIVETRDHATILTLNRPDKRNALTAEMLRGLRDAAEAAQTDVLVLTGHGGVFSAGADLAEMQTGLGDSPLWDEAANALASFHGLAIAALNGTLAGGAFGLALACKLRFAPKGARFFYPVIERGYLPRLSDARRLTALIGPAHTAGLLLTAERMTAERAAQTGLINDVCDDPLAHALHVSQAFARHPDTGRAILEML